MIMEAAAVEEQQTLLQQTQQSIPVLTAPQARAAPTAPMM